MEKTLLPDVKEKILLPEDVNGEAVVVSKLRSRDANEATEYSKSDDATLACELDTDADASRYRVFGRTKRLKPIVVCG